MYRVKNGIKEKIAATFTVNDLDRLGFILKLASDEDLLKIKGNRHITNLLYPLMEALDKKGEISFNKVKKT